MPPPFKPVNTESFTSIWELRICCVASQALNSHEIIDPLSSQVFRVDGMNRDTIVGYGSVLIPTQTGRYEKAVHVYAPQPSSAIQRFRSWITGAYPEVGMLYANHRSTRVVHLPTRRTLRLAHSVPQATTNTPIFLHTSSCIPRWPESNLLAYLIVRLSQFFDSKFVTRSEGREATRVKRSGVIEVSLDIMTRGE